jgi:hypothetical protein
MRINFLDLDYQLDGSEARNNLRGREHTEEAQATPATQASPGAQELEPDNGGRCVAGHHFDIRACSVEQWFLGEQGFIAFDGRDTLLDHAQPPPDDIRVSAAQDHHHVHSQRRRDPPRRGRRRRRRQ